MGFNTLVNSSHVDQGQKQAGVGQGVGKVIMKPALVVDTNDLQGMGRIKARVVEVDASGNIVGKKSNLSEKTNGYGGKDKDLTDEQLPICYPLIPRFYHSRPKKGEMVMVFFENPEDFSAPRHYIGPIITSDINLNFQGFESTYTMYDVTNFGNNPQRSTDGGKAAVFTIDDSDIALKGRIDSDLILKNKESILTCARFGSSDSYVPNLDTFSYLRLKHYKKSEDNIKIIKKQLKDSNVDILKEHSCAEINSTVICLYSPRGKYRGNDIKTYEVNKDLASFETFDVSSNGQNLADTLHPVPFGDEQIRLLDLIIRVLLNHIHTPQNPLLREAQSDELAKYTVDGLLQNIISNHVRIN